MRSQADPPESDHSVIPAPLAVPVRPSSYSAVPAKAEAIETPPRYAREYIDDAAPGGLLEYWGILRRHKGTIIIFAFLGLIAAVLVALPQTPVYQAHASLEIQTLNQDFMNMKQVSPVSEQSTDYYSNDIQTHIKLLQSDTLLERVINKLKQGQPRELYQPADRISTWRRALNLPQPKVLDASEQALRMARGSLKLRAAGQTRVIEILSDSTDPRLAAAFANTLANEYIDQSMEARWQMNQRTSEWLARQLDDMRIKLERSEDQLQRYARQTGLLFTGDKEKRNVSEEKLRQLQEELSKAQADRIARQSRYEMAQSAQPETLPDVLNDNSLREYQSKLTDLRRQEAELSATYRPEYSKVQKIKAQIATLEAALVRERQAITERIRNDYQEAQRREKLLANDYTNQAKLVTAESEKSIQYNILKREVDTTRQLYEGMIQRVKEASIASAMRASNVRVVDTATVPEFPYKPRVTMNGMIGLLVGLFVGTAFVLMRERADRTIQAPGDSQFYLHLPELGVIPETNSSALRISYYQKRKKLSPASSIPTAKENSNGNGLLAIRVGNSLAARSNGTNSECVELITHQRKRSVTAEAFRVVLTSILFSGENGSTPRVLVLTSAGPAEGKTTVTSNLAIALAEIRRKTLLIDADMRKPRLHRIFDVPNERGLSTVLQERSLSIDTLRSVVHQAAIPDLYVLPAGPTAASGHLYSPILPELLNYIKKEFDMVLIDTPPMLQMPDARIVGRQADAVVMVVRAGQTTRDATIAARERLSEDGTRVLGTILNNWNPRQSPNGYYGYSNGYGYYRGYANHYYAKTQESAD